MPHRFFTFAMCACSALLIGSVARSQTVPAGYTISTYASELPASSMVTTLAIDSATRTIFYSEASGQGALWRIAPDKTVQQVTANSSEGEFFPYLATDLQFANGAIYWAGSSGRLHGTDVATGRDRDGRDFPGDGV